jgi:DNA-binding PadR family transcriptional regulator
MPKKRFTTLKAFILGVMNTIPKPMSGYELISYAKDWRYDHYINATNASFYYTLKQLKDEGFIKELGSKQEGNRPEQTIYKLVSKGRKEFQNQMAHFLNSVQNFYFDIDVITPFLLLFGSSVGKEYIIKSINKQIEVRQKSFKHADEGEEFVKSHFLYDLSPFYILALKHWRFHNEAEIKWLQYFKTMVDGIENFKENYNETIKRSIAWNQDHNKE